MYIYKMYTVQKKTLTVKTLANLVNHRQFAKVFLPIFTIDLNTIWHTVGTLWPNTTVYYYAYSY